MFCHFQKQMKKRLKTNIIIFLVAIPLAIWLFWLSQNPNFLSASVISLQEQQAMKQNNRDLGYKNDGNTLDVFLDEKVDNLDYLTLSILYDPDHISFNVDDINTQIDYKILSNEDGNLLIQFNNFSNKNFDYKNSLFMLKFTWQDPSILVSQATAFLFTGTNKFLAIGSLNQYRQTHDQF